MLKSFAGEAEKNYTKWVKNTVKINCLTNVKMHKLKMHLFCFNQHLLWTGEII